MQSDKVRLYRVLASASLMSSGMFLCLVLTLTVALTLMKEFSNVDKLSKFVLKYLEDLYRSQPSNPAALLLYGNRNLLIESIRISHDKLIKWCALIMAIALVAMVISSACGMVAHVCYTRKIQCKECHTPRKKRKTAHLAGFMLGFSIGVTLLSLSLFTPFLIVRERNLGNILCLAFDASGFDRNPLAEVAKKILKETFKNEVIIENTTNEIHKYLIIILVISIVSVLSLVALSILLHSRESASETAPASPAPLIDAKIQNPMALGSPKNMTLSYM
ncbi:hypothetical protein NHE_0827 [Neorickettsia helminthoeca str. Oregon]|uniref:Uncharacterized protein n=1 Tax=Neorickettsia helminthoeca str. Oregon TaxID=1286528 RepID=X5HKY1_9RICK|nr:hypothetical protein [Neorickettsia helminthoeca]AHX11749.1 hypothetical protein NHE_0827 [Neorickettsia helminthoeca str. Oregon]